MDLSNDGDLDNYKSEDPLSFVSVSYEKKKMLRFTCQQDILLLNQVLAVNPYEALKQKLSWEHIAFLMMQHGLQVDGRRCRERTQLLLDYLQNREFRTLRKRGTEAENREKERLLHEILAMRDRRSLSLVEQSSEKIAQLQQERAAQLKNLQLLGLTVTNGSDPPRRGISPDQSLEKIGQAHREREAQIRNLQALGLSVTNGTDVSRTGSSSPNDNTASDKVVQIQPEIELEIKKLPTQGSSVTNGTATSRGSTPTPSGYATSGDDEPPASKRRCDESRLSTTPSSLHHANNSEAAMRQKQLQFALHQFETEMEQKKELMDLEKAKIKLERDKLEFEKVKFESERLEREKRLQMECEERKLLIKLLLKALHGGNGAALPDIKAEELSVSKEEALKGCNAKKLKGSNAESLKGSNSETLSDSHSEELKDIKDETETVSDGNNADETQDV